MTLQNLEMFNDEKQGHVFEFIKLNLLIIFYFSI